MSISRPEVLVAHAIAATREGIKLALNEHGAAVCAEASTRDGALRLAVRARPDVCLVDARLPGGATATIRRLTVLLRGVPVVVLGDIVDRDGFYDSVRAGACGYLSEAVDPAVLARTVVKVANGEAGIPRSLVMALVDAVREGATGRSFVVPERGRVELSRRQSQVVALAREGHSTAEIAARLAIDPATVRQHFFAVRRRLGVPNRSAAIALVPPGSV